jgi:hypothetical protein
MGEANANFVDSVQHTHARARASAKNVPASGINAVPSLRERERETKNMALPGLINALIGFFGAIVAFVLRVLSFFMVILSWIGIVLQSMPFVIVVLVVTAVMIPWISYHDTIIEEAEYGMSAHVYPAWRDSVRDFVNVLRRVYNPLVCWWNAINWWFFGLYREAVFPTAFECGIKDMLFKFGKLLFAVTDDFVGGYFASGNFLTETVDFTNITPAGIAFWDAWIEVYTCSCFDLGDIFRDMPIMIFFLIPIPSAPILITGPQLWWTMLFSEQWSDPETWCFLEHTVNTFAALAAEVIQLIISIIQAITNPPGPVPFPRPDFKRTTRQACAAVRCLVRSYENAMQRIWDRFIPFKFVFHKYWCIIDAYVCLLLVLIDGLLRLLINIDRAVFYPTDPFYETVIKPDFIELMNLLGTPSNFDTIIVPSAPNPTLYTISNYFLDPEQETTPLGAPNPMFGQSNLAECICILIQRTICDPSAEETACFSGGAQELLADFDFCCLQRTVYTTVVDLLSGFFEFTLHMARGSDEFFLFIDENPFPTVLKLDLTAIIECLLGVLTLIPDVGVCLRDFIVGLVKWVLCLVDFLVRVIVSLATLPYFLIRLPTVPSFLTRTSEALDFFVQINNDLIAPIPSSVQNCICLLLNKGFPVPPIPCPSCQMGGFIPQASRKVEERKRRFFDPVTGETYSPWQIAMDTLGRSSVKDSVSRVTPLIRYANHTTDPFKLAKMIWVNSAELSKDGGSGFPFPDMSTVDRFVDRKKVELMKRWDLRRQCSSIRQEDRELRTTDPRLWLYNRNQGHYDPLTDGTCPATDQSWMPKPTAKKDGKYAHEQDARLTLFPTTPPLTGCSDPIPPCFDLCCAIRAQLDVIVHLLNTIARFFNGFIQFEASRWAHLGVMNDFPYFTGEFCDLGLDCFESDVVMVIIKYVRPIKCMCEMINLLVPVTPDNPREDLCCMIQRIGELLACVFQVIINSISALALGGGSTPPFEYYVGNMFFEDVNTLFDIELEVVECLCVLVRGIFPLEFIPGFQEATGFDICCSAQALFTTAVEIMRFLLQIILSLATISVTPQSFCYFRLDTGAGCPGKLEEIGFVKQWDIIMDSLLPVRDSGCQQTCNVDQGQGGILPCLCQVLNTLIPARENPALAVSCDPADRNCPWVDFCCPMIKTGIALNDYSKFMSQAIAALWQSWDPGYPEFFTNYFFCDEDGFAGGCTATVGSPACGCGTFTCGKLKPVINSILDPFEGLISKCTCEFFTLLDLLLGLFFGLIPGRPWGNCFCGCTRLVGGDSCEDGNVGILPSLANIFRSIILVVTDLIRKFPLQCYWKPCNPDAPDFCTFDSIQESWIFSFLGPISDSLCIAVGNYMCFVNSIFLLPPQCFQQGAEFLGGTMRWAFEAIFRVVAFIEGFIRQFTDEPVTCVGANCGAGPGEYNGVSPNPLGAILTALISFPIDLLIGDSDVACTTICPCVEFGATPSQCIDDAEDLDDRCACWDFSGKYPGSAGDRLYIHTAVGCTVESGSPCCLLTVPDPDVPTFMPVCQSPSGPMGLEGSCTIRVACRPDTLPECAAHPDTPALLAAPHKGSLDGILVGLLRYLSCVLGPVGVIFKPIIILLSITWQILGGVVRFVSALVIFMLSLFSFEAGCDCHDFLDPVQNGTINHIQVGLLCYPCLNAASTCEQNTNICAPHCPAVLGGSVENCVALLNSGDPTADYNSCIGGGFGAGLGEGVSPVGGSGNLCDHLDLESTLCPDPGCQVGGNGKWPSCKCAGCTFPSRPLPLCSFLLAIGRFFDVIGAFIAIFEQPIIVVELRNLDQRPVGPTIREARHEFSARVLKIHQKRYGNFADTGNIFEAGLAALYDFDTADCYDDPVTCSCRNFHMPEHCTYNTTRRGVDFVRAEPMTTSELTSVVAEMFPDTSVCDHAVGRCGGVDWDTISDPDKDRWVECVNKRVQGERLNEVMPVVPKNFMYTTNGPYAMLENIVSNAHQGMYHEHQRHADRHQERARNFRQHWPRLDERMKQRRMFAREVLETKKGIKRTSPIFEAMVKADALWFKYKLGYYNYILERASTSVRQGNWNFPSTKEALSGLNTAFRDLGSTVYHQPYRRVVTETVHATRKIGRMASEVLERGVYASYTDELKRRRDVHWELYGRVNAENRAFMVKTLYDSPLYHWWNAPSEKSGMFGPFFEHIGRVVRYQRENWESENFSAWNADLKLGFIKEAFVRRWTPKWTPQLEENWNKPKRVALKVYDWVWPNTLSREIQEKFIFGCNCIIADRALAVTVNSIDYCLNGFMPNIDFARSKREGGEGDYDRLAHFLNSTSPFRKGGFYSHEKRWRLENTQPSDPDAWIRPRIQVPERKKRPVIDRRVYRRQSGGSGPTGFNLFDWLVCTVEDLFDTPLNQDLEQLIDDIRDWFSNPNTSVDDYPDVGFAYWATFSFRCEFPESLNCSIGIGLEEALKRVLVIGIILFFVVGYLFPAALPVLTFIIFVVAVPAVAWHYSPQCWFMTPSFPLGGGLSVPIWPFPVAFPALPECFVDEFVALADKYITDCYSGPGSPNMLIPPYLINGELCPTALGQRIDVANCKDVGVSDGIQNLLFLGYWTLGSGFCDVVLQIVSTCVGSWWPGLEEYIRATLEGFRDASDTQMKRQEFCFWATLPTILLPILGLFLIFTFFGFLVPAVIELFIALAELFVASPLYAAIPGSNQEWFELTMDGSDADRDNLNDFDDNGDDDDDDDDDDDYYLGSLRKRRAKARKPSGFETARSWTEKKISGWLFDTKVKAK